MVSGSFGTDPESPPTGGGAGNPGPGERAGVTTVCPECGGVLSERSEAAVTQWECRVGHRYSPASLVDAQAEDVEAALWAAVRILEDRDTLLRRMTQRAESGEQARSARSFKRRADAAAEQAQLVRQVLDSAATTTLRRLEAGEQSGEEEETAA